MSPETPDTFPYALVILKPDAVARDLVDTFREELTAARFRIQRRWEGVLSRAKAEAIYEDLRSKAPFDAQIEFMTSGPVVAFGVSHREDRNPCPRLRRLIGATMPADRDPESLRARFGDPVTPRLNCIHGSDSPDAALRELNIIF